MWRYDIVIQLYLHRGLLLFYPTPNVNNLMNIGIITIGAFLWCGHKLHPHHTHCIHYASSTPNMLCHACFREHYLEYCDAQWVFLYYCNVVFCIQIVLLWQKMKDKLLCVTCWYFSLEQRGNHLLAFHPNQSCCFRMRCWLLPALVVSD